MYLDLYIKRYINKMTSDLIHHLEHLLFLLKNDCLPESTKRDLTLLYIKHLYLLENKNKEESEKEKENKEENENEDENEDENENEEEENEDENKNKEENEREQNLSYISLGWYIHNFLLNSK